MAAGSNSRTTRKSGSRSASDVVEHQFVGGIRGEPVGIAKDQLIDAPIDGSSRLNIEAGDRKGQIGRPRSREAP